MVGRVSAGLSPRYSCAGVGLILPGERVTVTLVEEELDIYIADIHG